MNDSLEIPVDRVPLNPPKPTSPQPSKPAKAPEPESARAEASPAEPGTDKAKPPPAPRWVGEAVRDLFTWSPRKTAVVAAVGSLALGAMTINALMKRSDPPPDVARLQLVAPPSPTEALPSLTETSDSQQIKQTSTYTPPTRPQEPAPTRLGGLPQPSIEPVPTPAAPGLVTVPAVTPASPTAPAIAETPSTLSSPVVVPSLPTPGGLPTPSVEPPSISITPTPPAAGGSGTGGSELALPPPSGGLIIPAAAVDPTPSQPQPTPAAPGGAAGPTVPPVIPAAPSGPGGGPLPKPSLPSTPPAPVIPAPATGTPSAPPKVELPNVDPLPTTPGPSTPTGPARVEPSLPPPVTQLEVKPITQPEVKPFGQGEVKPITVVPTPIGEPAPGVPATLNLNKQPGESGVRPVGGADAAPPRTGFDVDLHEVQAGESFQTISKLHYGDVKYAEALRAYNRGADLGRVRELEVPPMYVLRQKYGQYLGAVRSGPEPARIGGGGIEWAGSGAPAQPREQRTYTVTREGMTLYDVSEAVYGTSKEWRRLFDVNQVAPEDKLPVGKVIKLP